MNKSPKEIVAEAAALRSSALDMLRRAQAGDSPLPGHSADDAARMLTENIAAYDDMIRRNARA